MSKNSCFLKNFSNIFEPFEKKNNPKTEAELEQMKKDLKNSQEEQNNQEKNLKEQRAELERTKHIVDQLTDENSKYRKG